MDKSCIFVPRQGGLHTKKKYERERTREKEKKWERENERERKRGRKGERKRERMREWDINIYGVEERENINTKNYISLLKINTIMNKIIQIQINQMKPCYYTWWFLTK